MHPGLTCHNDSQGIVIMISLQKFLIFIVLSSILVFSACIEAKQNKAFLSIWHPTFQGERLDYCTADGGACGKDVADHYCQMLGYDYSSDSRIAHNVGFTHYLATRLQCKGWRCNGFMNIICVTSLSHNPPMPYHYSEKKFVYPRYNNYRVDWCYDKNKGCGKRAANSFCARLGYLRANYFEKEMQVSATKTIGNQELCFGNQCTAFKTIICYR